MIQFKKNMKFSYVFSILFLSINVFSIENYVAEYRWESSDRDILGVRKLVIEENGASSLSFKANKSFIKLDIETDFKFLNKKVESKEYSVGVKPAMVNRSQKLFFNNIENSINSKGRYEWSANTISKSVLDPLNAQIQVRMNVLDGYKDFSIDIIEMKDGTIEPNFYKVTSENVDCYVGDDKYSCIEVTRLRKYDDRKTIYLIAEELGYMFVKIKDIDLDPKKNQTLSLEKILSLG